MKKDLKKTPNQLYSIMPPIRDLFIHDQAKASLTAERFKPYCLVASLKALAFALLNHADSRPQQ